MCRIAGIGTSRVIKCGIVVKSIHQSKGPSFRTADKHVDSVTWLDEYLDYCCIIFRRSIPSNQPSGRDCSCRSHPVDNALGKHSRISAVKTNLTTRFHDRAKARKATVFPFLFKIAGHNKRLQHLRTRITPESVILNEGLITSLGNIGTVNESQSKL